MTIAASVDAVSAVVSISLRNVTGRDDVYMTSGTLVLVRTSAVATSLEVRLRKTAYVGVDFFAKENIAKIIPYIKIPRPTAAGDDVVASYERGGFSRLRVREAARGAGRRRSRSWDRARLCRV